MWPEWGLMGEGSHGGAPRARGAVAGIRAGPRPVGRDRRDAAPVRAVRLLARRPLRHRPGARRSCSGCSASFGIAAAYATSGTGRRWTAKRRGSRGRASARRTRPRVRHGEARPDARAGRRPRRRPRRAAGTARRAPRSRSASCCVNFTLAAVIVGWAAKISPGRGGRRRARRLHLPPRADPRSRSCCCATCRGSCCRGSASRSSARTSCCSPGRRATSVCSWPRPGSARAARSRLEKNESCSASTFRPSVTSRSGAAARSASTRPSSIYIFATVVTIARLLPRHAQEGRARAVGHLAEHRRVGHRLRPQPDHHADDGRRRARLPAVPDARCSSSSSSATSPRSCPVVQFPANARFGDAAGARAAHLGDLQRRRHQAAGPGPLLRELGVPAARRHERLRQDR